MGGGRERGNKRERKKWMERKGEKEEGMGRRKSVERGEVMWNRKKGRREEGKGRLFK